MPDTDAPATRQVVAADDDPALRRLLETNLLAAGYEPICAAAGDEAWVHLQTELGPMPLLVISGAFYPKGISGCELLARMRGEPNTRRVPLLLLLPMPPNEPAPPHLVRIARWDWGMLAPLNPALLIRAIPEIARLAALPEPFQPPPGGEARRAWQWWRDRLSRHGLEYPDR